MKNLPPGQIKNSNNLFHHEIPTESKQTSLSQILQSNNSFIKLFKIIQINF